MTLTAIRLMFAKFTCWTVDNNGTVTRRIVAEQRRDEIVFLREDGQHVYFTLPKASEVIHASDGLLSMRYRDHEWKVLFGRIVDPATIREVTDTARGKLRKLKAEEARGRELEDIKAKVEAEARLSSIAQQVRTGRPVPPRDLIDLCESLGHVIPIQTKGALLRKVIDITDGRFSYRHGKRPRFSSGHHPCDYYTLAARGPEKPEPPEVYDPEVERLFRPHSLITV